MGEGTGAIWGRCGSGGRAGGVALGWFCGARRANGEGGTARKGAMRGREVSGGGRGVGGSRDLAAR